MLTGRTTELNKGKVERIHLKENKTEKDSKESRMGEIRDQMQSKGIIYKHFHCTLSLQPTATWQRKRHSAIALWQSRK